MAVEALGLAGVRPHDAMAGKALRELGWQRRHGRYFPPAQAPSGGLAEAGRGSDATEAPKPRHEALESRVEGTDDDAGWRAFASELASVVDRFRPTDAAWRAVAEQRRALHARGELPWVPLPDRDDDDLELGAIGGQR